MPAEIRPMNDRIVVKPVELKNKPVKSPAIENPPYGEVRSPGEYGGQILTGEVISVGQPLYKRTDEIYNLPNILKPGDIIAFKQYSATEIIIGEEKYWVVAPYGIEAIITGITKDSLKESLQINPMNFDGKEPIIQGEVTLVNIWRGLPQTALSHSTESALKTLGIKPKSLVPGLIFHSAGMAESFIDGKYSLEYQPAADEKVFPAASGKFLRLHEAKSLAGNAQIIAIKFDSLPERNGIYDISSAGIAMRETIKKEGDKYVLYSADGKKKLGTHETMMQALAQERAIKMNESKVFPEHILEQFFLGVLS